MTSIAASSIFTILLVSLTPNIYLKESFIVLGQAHCLLGYLYGYRAGRYSSFFAVVLYAIALVLIYLIGISNEYLFIAAVSSFVLFHNFYDEMHLSEVKNSRLMTFYFLPIVLSLVIYGFCPNLVRYGGRYLDFGLFVFSLVPLLIISIRREFSRYTIYIGFKVAVIGLILFFHLLIVGRIWTFLVISHYMLWYVKVAQRLRLKDQLLYKTYLKEAVIGNVLVIGLWIFSLQNYAPKQIYDYFFSPVAFFAWTLMHVVVTLRVFDYKALFATRAISASFKS